MISLVCASACAAAQTPSPRTELAQKLDHIVERYHASGELDGVVVVRSNDKIVYARAIGTSGGRAIQVADVFPYASITKQVTALLVMQEVEANHISLDAPIAADSTITVRQLLQHTSGLADPEAGTKDGEFPAFYLRRQIGTAAEEAASCMRAPTGVQGTFHYNNCDYIVLGAMLEKVTGRPYADLVRTRISEKLHLESWGVFGAQRPPRVAIGRGDHDEPAPDVNYATYGAAGALYGNATDLARFAQALLDGELLGPAATAEMFHGNKQLQMEALGSWQYELNISGAPIDLVERQGDIAGIRTLSLLSRSDHFTIEILASTERAPLFELWAKRGLSFDLVRAVAR